MRSDREFPICSCHHGYLTGLCCHIGLKISKLQIIYAMDYRFCLTDENANTLKRTSFINSYASFILGYSIFVLILWLCTWNSYSIYHFLGLPVGQVRCVFKIMMTNFLHQRLDKLVNWSTSFPSLITKWFISYRSKSLF